MAKIKAVNVVEISGGVLCSITSFTDDDEGNKEAEGLMGRLIHADLIQTLETDDPEIQEAIEVSLDNGIYEGGDYEILITHSS